jgi:hypothetical protein
VVHWSQLIYNGWTELDETSERRLSRRYKIGLAIKLRVSEGSAMSEWRIGKTCEVSTTGVMLECAQPLPINARIEMVMDWPAMHDNLYPICLRAVGEVVRIDGREMAVRMAVCRMVIEKATSPQFAAASSSGI